MSFRRDNLLSALPLYHNLNSKAIKVYLIAHKNEMKTSCKRNKVELLILTQFAGRGVLF